MSNLSNQKLLSGKTRLVGPSVAHQNIEDLNPSDFEGALAYSTDGVMYFSDGLSWSVSEVPPIRKPFALETFNSTHRKQLRLSPFLASGGYTATQAVVRFIASLTPDLRNPFLDVLIVSPTQSSYDITLGMPGGPTHGITFYWRAKYIATDGQESAFSSRQTLEYPQLIDKPLSLVLTNVEAGELEVTPFYSAFGRTVSQTQWEIYPNAAGTGTPTSVTNGTRTLSALQQSPIGLPFSWRARYRDTLGVFSEWSTLQYNIQPKLIDDPVPLIGDGDEALVLAISAYRSQIGRPYAKTTWQIFSTDNVATTPLLAVENGNTSLDTKGRQTILLVGTRYYWRARYQDLFGSVSAWTTVQSYILPKLINDTISTVQANVETRILSVGSYFSAYDVLYGQTQWQIFTNPAGTGTPLYSVSNSSLSLDTLTIVGASSGLGYHWRARFVGAGGQASAYSTIQGYLQPLSLAQPILVTVANSAATVLTVQGYSSLRNAAFANTLWEVYNNPAGTGLPIATRTTAGLFQSTRGFLANGQTGYWRARFRDEFGDLSSWSSTRAYVQPVSVAAPVLVTEVNTVATVLAVQGYASPYGSVFANTLWEVYDNALGTGLPLASRTNTGYTISTQGLAPNSQTVYWRARFRDDTGDLSPFSALQAYIQPVAITTPTLVTAVNASAPVLTVQGYFSIYGSAFANTLWEVYDNALGTGAIIASRPSAGVTLSTLALAPNRQLYYWRARFVDAAGGLSAFSVLQAYTQELPISSPTQVTANGAVTDTLSVSAFSSIYGFLFAESQWEVYTTPEPISTPFATTTLLTNAVTLAANTLAPLANKQGLTYYWRMRYKASSGVFSEWSVMSEFTLMGGIDTPTAITAVGTDTGSLVVSNYSSPNGLVYQNTSWEIYSNEAGTGSPLVTTVNTLSSLSLNPFTALIPNTSYYWRARYQSTKNGQYSDWTSIRLFTVAGPDMLLEWTISNAATPVTIFLGGTVNVTVSWGDGTQNVYTTQTTATKTFAANGTYLTRITGTLTQFGYYEISLPAPYTGAPTGMASTRDELINGVQTRFYEFYHFYNINQNQPVRCLSFGSALGLTSLRSAFRRFAGVTFLPGSLPPTVTSCRDMFAQASQVGTQVSSWNTSNITDMSFMFHGCGVADLAIGSWNTANVTNMSNMFNTAINFNQNISTWNTANVTNMSNMFNIAINFNQPIGTWNVSNVTNMSNMFNTAINFNQPIGTWNVSNVTNMQRMFQQNSIFNQPIGTWNVSNVTNMSYMFRNATTFNQPIGAWNTAKVTSTRGMFMSAQAFNQPVGSWDMSLVTDIAEMFFAAGAFNQPIGGWNTANVTDMNSLFYGTIVFNQPIGAWNTVKVTNMAQILRTATAFNQPIGTWNVSNVTNMTNMFDGAPAFNQPIGAWNTGNVVDMQMMFRDATAFNQPIGTWNTIKVFNTIQMFNGATAFNQPIGTWNMSVNSNQQDMFINAGLSVANYDNLLNGWAAQTLIAGRSFHGGNSRYSSTGLTGRNTLTSTPNNWTITDGGLAP